MLAEYTNSLKGKKITVIGIGISNKPLIRLLLDGGCDVTVCDKKSREELGNIATEYEGYGAKLCLGEDYLDNIDADIIFRTPGLKPNTPQLVEARARNIEITSEMEVFFDLCPCRIIGVTGSDGKTTTTALIAKILEYCGLTIHLGGNIGEPLLCRLDKMEKTDIVVVELSSFQLMTMKKSPDIAVITNVTPNHLDYHKDMEEYVDAKRNIFRYQNETGVLVTNLDNEIAKSFVDEAPGAVRLYGKCDEMDNGVYYNESMNAICSAVCKLGGPVIQCADLQIPGMHNIENVMAAMSAAKGFVLPETMRKAILDFKGIEHRIELVRTLRGVKYYNDSIASSPTRTIAGLKSFDEKVILIAGGKDKGVPFDEVGEEIVQHVKKLVLTGVAAETLRDAVVGAPGYSEGAPEITIIKDFTEAVKAAAGMASDGDVVILSPACTSYDSFKNFEERGKTFKKIVNELE